MKGESRWKWRKVELCKEAKRIVPNEREWKKKKVERGKIEIDWERILLCQDLLKKLGVELEIWCYRPYLDRDNLGEGESE